MKHLLNRADPLTRRDFVAACAKTFLGVGMIGFGSSSAQAQAYGRIPKAKNVIYLYMGGGMSHIDTFDPKPQGPADIRGPVNTSETSADDIFVSEFLPQTAQEMDKVCVINSMSSNQGAHEQGTYIMHTSYPMRGTIRHPGLGAWVVKLAGARNQAIPPYVLIGGGSRYAGSGFFESKFSPLVITSPNAGLQNSARPEDVSEERYDSRLELAQQLDAGFINRYNVKEVRAYRDMYDDALKLMRSRDLDAFDIAKESEEVRQEYGNSSFGQGCLLARRLVENDVRFVEVGLGGWDTHTNNFISVSERCSQLDQGLGTLLKDLHRRGMLGETLVVLATEFGRTPRVNGNEGRDHYPAAFTCLLAGGGIKGGYRYGKTDDSGANVVENKVSVPDFNATIAHALGLPLEKTLYSPSRRPFTVAHKGKPVMDLFA